MKAIYIVLMTVFAGIFCYCLMAVFSYHRDARENKKETEEVMREVIQKVPEGYGGAVAEPKIDFEKLEQMNSDVAGWIVFHEPYVNGPLVQADDNSYYLDHSFRKKENSAGCLFMDYRNQSFDDRHVVIYGHNMLDRTMFGSLRDVFQEKFWEGSECDLIWITDRDQHLRKYKIFSCYIAGKEEDYTAVSFADAADYTWFLKKITARSYRKTDVTVTADDHILTLSTCAGVEGTDKRRVIHAKLL